MKVLFLNHKVKNCGVYQYGLRVCAILKKSTDITYVYVELDSVEEYYNAIEQNKDISAVIYNYHSSTMPWLNTNTIQKTVKNIGIPHESPENLFNVVCSIDPTIQDTPTKYSLPRPIFENIDELINHTPSTPTIKEFIEYSEENVPVFGSFGFGFDNKGFEKIVRMVNSQYDKAIIKFVIPVAHFDWGRENTVNGMRHRCIMANTKSTIKLMISHEFFSNEDILKFLQSNTMNIFLYDEMHGRGVSSVIDYAISVKKPLGISDSYMFRNIYSDEICLYKKSIEDCIKTSVTYCDKFLKLYCHDNLIAKFKQIIC